MVTGSGPNAAKWVPFTWVNTALGNIKTALAGTYHHVSAKHAQRYVTSWAWRFNRRYQPRYPDRTSGLRLRADSTPSVPGRLPPDE